MDNRTIEEVRKNEDRLIKEIEKLERQQQEFIIFLEDNWKNTQDIWYIKILNKYKEIVGIDK